MVSARNQRDLLNGSPIALLDQLREKISPGSLMVYPEREGYYLGERISVEVFSPDGCSLGMGQFSVVANAGSGFAGQVYKAFSDNDALLLGEGGGETPPLAIKVLKPKSRSKRLFRDLLFQLSFQTSYPPRLREDSLRAGLIWQVLLRLAAGVEFGAESAVARPLGYFWDSGLGSYAEIHEWVDGRSARYEADDGLLLRFLRRESSPPHTEMERKKQFMGALACLCRDIGALGLARQYEWFTFVSQANVLTRRDASIQNEFTAVDCRPGLAVPFFLPLSPVHARLILAGLKRGKLAHFDEVDFEKLDRYVNAHDDVFESVQELIRRLKEDDASYRAGLPDIWQAGKRKSLWKSRWEVVISASVEDHLKLGHLSDDWAVRLKGVRAASILFYLLDRLPVLGPLVLRLTFNEDYQEHVRLAVSDAAYFKEWFTARKAADLLSWYGAGRISAGRCEKLSRSTPVYLSDKLLLSWLPASAHRLLTDASFRARLIRAWFVLPFILMVNRMERERWLIEILQEQVEKGVLAEDRIGPLKLQIREPLLQRFIRDLGFTLGLEVFAKILYLGLAAYGFLHQNFLLFGVAVLSPIPPSGVVRAAYVFAHFVADLPRILKDRDKKLLFARWIGLASAPWRGWGNLFALFEMFTYYSELSLLLGNRVASRMVAYIPVLGGEGKLLEYWVFQAAYNFPLSFRSAVLQIPSWWNAPTDKSVKGVRRLRGR